MAPSYSEEIPATDWNEVKAVRHEHYPGQTFRPDETPESCCDGGKICTAPVKTAEVAAIVEPIRRTEPDIIRTPPHYTFAKIEPLDAIHAWGLPFELGNVVKYLVRARHKGNELLDLEKAAEYLRRYIEFRTAELNDEEPVRVSER